MRIDVSEQTGLFRPEPRQLVVRDLVERAKARLLAQTDEERVGYLEDALYWERRRLEGTSPEAGVRDRMERLGTALVRGDRHAHVRAALSIVSAWAEEIHGRFDPRLYRVARRHLPKAFAGLLLPRPRRLRDIDLRLDHRVRVHGDLELLRALAGEATLVLAPTHVSNLDSPLIGYALSQAGLPPFLYGAGLNLFSNPLMGWFLRRLGAYTVDRTKRAMLYKDVLKDYSVRSLVVGHHSLFFPGGTRSRNGAVEKHLKKGLLGTGLLAWQELLASGRPREIYVVPLTLSFQLVLEAETLVDDYLQEAGKQRYIITDDEFSKPARVLSFTRRMLELDASVHVHFGAPMDCLGRPVARERAERADQAVERRRYVISAGGEPQRDPQRDRVYTERLATRLIEAYPKGTHVLATSMAAWAAWRGLEERCGHQDAFRVVRTSIAHRAFSRTEMVGAIRTALDRVRSDARDGRCHVDLPETAEEVLDLALRRFGVYHRTRALVAVDDRVIVQDPRLCYYYRNRLV